MSSKLLKVLRYHVFVTIKANPATVIARQALAQEDNTDFGNDYPEAIPINLEQDRDGCAC